MRIITGFWILAVSLFFSCNRHAPSDESPVVAQVGSSKLTLADIRQSIPPEYSSVVSLEQYKEYIRRWTENEILYQESLRKKLDKDRTVVRRVERAKRDILVAEIISLYCSGISDVLESKIQQYYDEHVKEFTRDQWELKSLHILIPDQKNAWAVRQKITPENFQTLARQYSIDPVDDSATASYVSARDMIPELVTEAFGIRVGGTTPIIKTPRGYYIMYILDKQAPGSARGLAEVRDEIANRLSAGRQKKQVQELLDSLRKTTDVELRFDRLPGYAEPGAGGRPASASPDSSVDTLP